MEELDLSDIVALFFEPSGDPKEPARSADIREALGSLEAAIVSNCFAGSRPPTDERIPWQVVFMPAQTFSSRRGDILSPDAVRSAARTFGHFTMASTGTDLTMSYDLRRVLVEALAVPRSATGGALLDLLRPRERDGLDAQAIRVLGGGPVPALLTDRDLLDKLENRRKRTARLARQEVRNLGSSLERAFACPSPKMRRFRIDRALNAEALRWSFDRLRCDPLDSPRALCPDGEPVVPALGYAHVLTSVLALILLEAEFEVESSALLPLELATGWQVGPSWSGWGAHPETGAMWVRNKARSILRADLYGQGVEGLDAKHAVIPATSMMETWRLDEARDGDLHDWTAVIPRDQRDPGLFEERGFAEVEARSLGSALAAEMSAADRRAAGVEMEHRCTGSSVIEICRARNLDYQSMRKAIERMRRNARKRRPEYVTNRARSPVCR